MVMDRKCRIHFLYRTDWFDMYGPCTCEFILCVVLVCDVLWLSLDGWCSFAECERDWTDVDL